MHLGHCLEGGPSSKPAQPTVKPRCRRLGVHAAEGPELRRSASRGLRGDHVCQPIPALQNPFFSRLRELRGSLASAELGM